MAVSHALEDRVAQGLHALGAQVSQVANGIWNVSLPVGTRRFFDGAPNLTLVFDYDTWHLQPSKSVFVAHGSQFLEQLERALAPPASVQDLWGGELLPDHDVVERWTRKVRVLGTSGPPSGAGDVLFQPFHHLEFEVELPGPPPTTEVIPVLWSAHEDRVLSPPQAAELLAQHWYTRAEAHAFLSEEAETDQTSRITAQERAQDALVSRLAPSLLRQRAERSRQTEAERERLQREANARIEAIWAGRTEESESEVERGLERRLALLQRRIDGRARVRLLNHTVLQQGAVSYVARFRRADSSGDVWVPLPRVAGAIRHDLCSWCDEPRNEYVLAPTEESSLACTECATACIASHCGLPVRRRGPPDCRHCHRPSYCSEHHVGCSACLEQGSPSSWCPEHANHCSFDGCANSLCPTHTSWRSEEEPLCPEHSAVCSVAGEVLRRNEVSRCPVTEQLVCAQHGVHAPDDPRRLHPDGTVRCGTSQRVLAKDRAGRCSVDNGWHALEHLSTSDATNATCCSGHLVAVDRPVGWRVELERVLSCPESNLRIDVSASSICSVSREACFVDALVTCPVTRQLFRPSLARLLPDDDRVLHPSAVDTCNSTGLSTARDRLAKCGIDKTLHRTTHLIESDATRELLCEAHRIRLDEPEGWEVEPFRAIVCAETGKQVDVSLAAKCSVSQEDCFAHALLTCPITLKRLRPSLAQVLPDDGRALHPEAVVFSVLSGRPVALDRAIWDDLSFQQSSPLHPSEAATCEHSGKAAAAQRLVTVECCGKRVAPTFVHASTASGRPGCPVHASKCAVDGAVVLSDETITCAVTGRQVCHAHAVHAECGAVIGIDRALVLESERWGCPDHFGLCATGTHPVPRERLERCTHCGDDVCGAHLLQLCTEGRACNSHFETCVEDACSTRVCIEHGRRTIDGRPICPTHAVPCTECSGWVSPAETLKCHCHDQPHHAHLLAADPYRRDLYICESGRVKCSRCGAIARAHAASSECKACVQRGKIDEVPGARAAFEILRPEIPRFALFRRIVASGGPDTFLFEVLHGRGKRAKRDLYWVDAEAGELLMRWSG